MGSGGPPPGFEEFAPPAMHPHKTFTHYMMEAVGAYVILSGCLSLGPRLTARLARGKETPESRLIEQLQFVPPSKFSLHHADLRTPLPALDELSEHPIGVKD